MSTKIFFILLFFFVLGQGFDENFSIHERFIPLGQHFQFSCDAYGNVKQKNVKITDVQWLYRNMDEMKIFSDDKNGRFFHDKNDHSLKGFEIQRMHEGIFECHVTYENERSNYYETTAIEMKVQDCNVKIDSNASHTLRNPCQFGQCMVLTSPIGGTNLQKLYCECAEQYTGLYCDVLISGTWYRELLFYSPTVGHFIFTGILFLSFRIWRSASSKERVTLINNVPDLGQPFETDTFDALYPAAREMKPQPPLDPSIPQEGNEEIHLAVVNETSVPVIAQLQMIQQIAALCREQQPTQRPSNNPTEGN